MDPNELTYKKARSIKFFFHRQVWHLLSLLILVPIVLLLANSSLGSGSWQGISTQRWFFFTLIVPIIHQIIVWVVFRLQLGWATLSKAFGKADLVVWGFLFLPLFIGRVITLVALSRATQGSLPISSSLSLIIALILLLPALYTFWSVARYFGLVRAMVGDHFRLKYRTLPLETRGIFQFSSNAMYAYGFLLLWAIALLNRSFPALIIAAFQHIYIWVHYYTVEKRDLDIIFPEH